MSRKNVSNQNKGNGNKSASSRQGSQNLRAIRNNSQQRVGNAFNGDSKLRMAPVAKQRTVKVTRAKITTSLNGDCRVVHREYVKDVVGSVAFTNTLQSINPGQTSIFSWLSRIARNFESYRFNKLRFLFETEAPTTEPGTIIIAIDYDASDPAAPSKQQIMAYRGSVRSAPWSECQHDSVQEDLNKQKSYFVRTGNAPANTDIKLYDVGTLQIATIGNSGAVTIGELYVEYDILLITPELGAPDAFAGGRIVSGGTESAANPMGDAPVTDPQSQGFTINAASVITFTTVGTFWVTFRIVAGTTITNQTITPGASVTTIIAYAFLVNTGATVSDYHMAISVNDLVAPTIALAATAAGITIAETIIGASPTGSLA